MKYYVAVVKSGREPITKLNIERRFNIMGMGNLLGHILVPVVEDKLLYPGYILIQMESDLIARHLVERTPGVINLFGEGNFVSDDEMEVIKKSMMERIGEDVRIQFSVGDRVKVHEGSLKDMIGTVTDVPDHGSRVTINVPIFGRSSPVNIDVSFLKTYDEPEE